MTEWTVATLKQYVEKIFEEKEKANNQRFIAQESAIDKAEANRDTAIKKAEDSIEKKSDAVYVKLTDLQKAFSEVMLRPEVESRIGQNTKDIADIRKAQDNTTSKGIGVNQGWGWAVAVAMFALAIYGFLK